MRLTVAATMRPTSTGGWLRSRRGVAVAAGLGAVLLAAGCSSSGSGSVGGAEDLRRETVHEWIDCSP